MNFRRLLAKSSLTPERPRDFETLQGHTAHVLAAAESLVRARLTASLDAVGLSSNRYEARARAAIRLAAFIHDLGKASAQFQAVVRRQRAVPQAMRHEAVSLWLCWPGQPLSEWLRPAVRSDTDYACAVVAAAGHHRKFWSSAFAPDDVGAGAELVVSVSHVDFERTLRLGARKHALEPPPCFVEDITLKFSRRDHPKTRFAQWQAEAEALERGDTARFLGVIKALTIAADVAGSCLPRAGERDDWIDACLARASDPDALQRVATRRLNGAAPRPFQEQVAASQASVTLVRAGCGTGKTLAAYLWASARHADRQLWFTYPTTGTATEGFRDYLFDADIEASLEHGRAQVDVEIFGLLGDADDRRDFDRLEALRIWGKKAVACTVDTALGLLQHCRKGMYAWPGISHAAIVFDEVHAYDDRLFDGLLHFLEAFPGLPCLLMTASLPTERLTALRAATTATRNSALFEVDGPEGLETLPRYVLRDGRDPWPLIAEAAERAMKVLWVSNTVRRSIEVSEEAERRGLQPLVYHSRFRYEDRVRRHGAVIDAFRSPGFVFASTTQVAEMSLDLSADLLITDMAPIPALIQRLGRLNRRSSPEHPELPQTCVLLPFEQPLPYEEAELDEARVWSHVLLERPCSQRDLITAWVPRAAEQMPRWPSPFRDGGFCTEAGEVREPSPGLTVLREQDAARIGGDPNVAARLALPMNTPPREWVSWPRFQFYPIAPGDAIDYDPQRGGRWRKH